MTLNPPKGIAYIFNLLSVRKQFVVFQFVSSLTTGILVQSSSAEAGVQVLFA